MTQKDYTPYRLTEEQPGQLKLRLKKKYSALWFIMFRILPWILLLCLGLSFEGLSDALPKWFYQIWLFSIGGLSVYLLLYRYTTEITLAKGSITRRMSSFYIHWNETEILHTEDTIRIIKERGGRSVYWAFYLVQGNHKKRILHIPIFISENTAAKNNFIEAFEHKCGTTVHFIENTPVK